MLVVAKSNAADTQEAFNASLIEGLKVSFRPGKLFKNELATAEFKKIESSEA